MSTTAIMNGTDITISSSQLAAAWKIERVEADPLTGEYDRIAGLMSKNLQLALAAGDNLNVAMDEVRRSAADLVFLKEQYELATLDYWNPSPGFTVKQKLIQAGVVFPVTGTQWYVDYKNPDVLGWGYGNLLTAGDNVVTVNRTLAELKADPSTVASGIAYFSRDGIPFGKLQNPVTGLYEIQELTRVTPYPLGTLTAAQVADIKDAIRTAADKSTLVSLDLQNTVQKLVAEKSVHELGVSELIKLKRRQMQGVTRNI